MYYRETTVNHKFKNQVKIVYIFDIMIIWMDYMEECLDHKGYNDSLKAPVGDRRFYGNKK